MRLFSVASITALFLATTLLLSLDNPAIASGDYSPILELGTNFHSGATGKSLKGGLGYLFAFRSERKKTLLRPTVALEIASDIGKASIGAAEPTATVFTGDFAAGCNFFAFGDTRFAPFFGVHGHIGWALMKMTSPPAGVEPHTQGLAFGYELTAGVDLRGNEGAFRIRTGMYNVNSTLAGVSGFALSGWRFTLGYAW